MDNGEISLRAELSKMENPEEIKKLAEDAEMSGYEDVAKMANEKITEILAKANTVEKTSESQISQVESMGGSVGEIEKRTEGIDKQIEEVKTNATGEIEKVKNLNSEGEKATPSITEKDAEIKNVETQTEEKIGEVKNEVEKTTIAENKNESKEMTKDELRETLDFLQKCEIIDKNIKEIGNFSPEAQSLHRIKIVLEHNKNLEQAPQCISELKDKFKDFLDDKVALMGRGYGKHLTLTSEDKAFPQKREIVGHLENDEGTSKKFDTIFGDYQGWNPVPKYVAGNINGGTTEKNTFVLKDFLAGMETYYSEEKPIELSVDEQNLNSKYQEAKKIIDSLPEDQKKEIEVMQKKVLQENLKNSITENLNSGKHLNYLSDNIGKLDDFGLRNDLSQKLREKIRERDNMAK